MSKSRTHGSRWRRRTDVLPTSVRFHPWRLGFRQSSLRPIAQALQDHSVHIFCCLPLYQPCSCPLALSGLGQVFASESSALNSGHLWWQFRPCVTRRTLSPHSAFRLACGLRKGRFAVADGEVHQSRRTVICFPLCIRLTSFFDRLPLADLHPVQAITAWRLATTPPPPSVPYAGIFASHSRG